jgi:hypothetical protein
MDDELRAKIITWVNENVTKYILRSPGDYWTRLAQDAVGRFGSLNDTDEAKELRIWIADVVHKRLNCEY